MLIILCRWQRPAFRVSNLTHTLQKAFSCILRRFLTLKSPILRLKKFHWKLWVYFVKISLRVRRLAKPDGNPTHQVESGSVSWYMHIQALNGLYLITGFHRVIELTSTRLTDPTPSALQDWWGLPLPAETWLCAERWRGHLSRFMASCTKSTVSPGWSGTHRSGIVTPIPDPGSNQLYDS